MSKRTSLFEDYSAKENHCTSLFEDYSAKENHTHTCTSLLEDDARSEAASACGLNSS